MWRRRRRLSMVGGWCAMCTSPYNGRMGMRHARSLCCSFFCVCSFFLARMSTSISARVAHYYANHIITHAHGYTHTCMQYMYYMWHLRWRIYASVSVEQQFKSKQRYIASARCIYMRSITRACLPKRAKPRRSLASVRVCVCVCVCVYK